MRYSMECSYVRKRQVVIAL